MKGKNWAWIAGAVMMTGVLFLFSCQSSQFNRGKYAIIMKSRNNWYNELASEGFKQTVEDAGKNCIVLYPDHPSAQEQIHLIQNLIDEKVEAIAVAANDEYALTPVLTQAREKGISVITLDADVEAGSRSIYISPVDALELGKELVIKQFSWDSLIPALGTGDNDAVIACMTANADREESADFTTPYYDSQGMIMIVRKDSEEASYTDIQQFSGKNVVGQNGTNYDEVIDQIEGVNHITPKRTYAEMVLALQAGDVDGITAEIAVAEGVVAANPDLTYITFDEGKGFEADTTVSIALKEGSRDGELFNAVQDALDNIDQDTRKAYMQKAVEIQPAE